MSGHIINDFKDLRSLIGEITKANPAKTTHQQNAEKMGVTKEAEAQPKDDKGDRGIARTLKKHAGEDDIKKAYMKLGRSAQGSVEYQRKLLQKQLSKMGFKTYSKFAFDNLFKFESNQMVAKWLINEVQLESALSDMRNIVKTKGARKINGIMVDMFTASVITQAYDKVNDANKKKMEKANLQTLVKLAHKIMGMKEELNLNESKMGDLLIDIQMGATAKELAKDHDISLAAAKNFLSDYYGRKKSSKAPGLKKEGIDEGKMKDIVIDFEDGVPDMKIAKSYGVDIKVVKGLKKDWLGIQKKHQQQLAAQNDPMKEGTMTVPKTKQQQQALKKVLQRPLKAKDAQQAIQNYIDDDGLADKIGAMSSNKDAREVIIQYLRSHGPNKRKSWWEIIHGMSKEEKLKEQKEHAKQSPFKLKSQAYPRAIAINTDGFGHRHATVEDIIAACDSFGMILDKELQVEQIQKQLGKKGFISYKKSELEDVFEERETQRIILTLESTVEKQDHIGYTKEEIIEAYIMGEEIEFLKPDGFKTVGPVLKKSGNTYNVKDKFTGKSYTYKYIEETEVKTFKEVINEGKFSSKLIKQAGGIAFDKRYYMGNMSGAIKAIEKLKKGLSDDPKVRDMLRIANEGKMANMDEYIKADGTRKRVNASDKRLKDNKQVKEGDKEEYEKFFNSALKKFGVSSPDELEGEKKKEFFDYIDKNWKADHEEVDVHSSYKVDGRRKNFREKMKKLGYIKATR